MSELRYYDAIETKEAVTAGGLNGARRRWVRVSYTVLRRGDRVTKVRRFVGQPVEEALAWATELNTRAGVVAPLLSEGR